jgi:hypothetical protein
MEPKTIRKIVGIVLVVVGAGLLYTGYQMSQSFGNEIARAFTGASTDDVTYRYIAGAAGLLVGLFLLFKK